MADYSLKYYINYRCADEKIFIAKTKIMKKTCICLGSFIAIYTEKLPTGGLRIGDVGFDIYGNKIEILKINPTI